MNILITGSTGFIGKAITQKLLIEGHGLFFSTRSLNPQSNSINLGISGHDEVVNFLTTNKIEGIIHLASLFLVTHKPSDIRNFIESNITFPSLLLEAAKAAGLKWLINTGTFWQHHNNEEYNPVNFYAATKQAFEDILKYYSETSPMKILTLELSDTYGPNDVRGKIFNRWLQARETQEEMNMSPGQQRIDILYIDDVVEAYLHSLNYISHVQTKPIEKFSLYSPNSFSLKEMSEQFEDVFNTKLKIHWGKLPYRDREVMQTWNRGKSLPSWKAKNNFEQGCKLILKSFPNS